MFQGSVLSPLLFNVYLDNALQTDAILKKSIGSGNLWAFADDILLTASGKSEMEQLIARMGNLKETHALVLNKAKSKVITDLPSTAQCKEIGGIEIVDSFKYLGLEVSLSRRTIVENAERAVQKNLLILRNRIRTRDY